MPSRPNTVPAVSAGVFCRPVSAPAVVPVLLVAMPPPVSVTVAWSPAAARPSGKVTWPRIVFGEEHEDRSTEPLEAAPLSGWVDSTAPVVGLTVRTWVVLAISRRRLPWPPNAMPLAIATPVSGPLTVASTSEVRVIAPGVAGMVSLIADTTAWVLPDPATYRLPWLSKARSPFAPPVPMVPEPTRPRSVPVSGLKP